MHLKEPHKKRVLLDEIEWGDSDNDGQNLALYNGKLYSGYAIIDHLEGDRFLSECEYKNGSQLGWENEYNETGYLVYSCLTVGPFLSLETYNYDDEGNVTDHYKMVSDDTYKDLCYKFKLLE